MNDLMLNNNESVMSSIEIAELTGKEHRKVMRDIKNILEEAEIDTAKFGRIYLDSMNREQKEYLLPKLECDLVVSGYSVKYRMAIIKRWHELEAAKPAPTKLELAKNLVKMFEALELKEKQVAILKVELDDSKCWSSIKRVEQITGEQFSWRKLKACMRDDSERRDIFDANYGTVKSYSAELWLRAYSIDLELL